jgi:DNA-binding NarL/FixJ family response regulator
MKITDTTAKKHRELLCERFNIKSRAELVYFAIQNGLTTSVTND